MEDNKTMPQKNSSPENDSNLFPSRGHGKQSIESEHDEPSQINADSGHAPKQVQKFYFVKIWPTDPDSILKIKKAERVIEEMNHQHLQITEKIKEKMSELDQAMYRLQKLDYHYRGYRSNLTSQAKILNALNIVLDELRGGKNARQRGRNRSGFKGDLDKHKLNILMLHGNKSLAEEKKILREISLCQQRDADPFSPLEELRSTIYRNYYGYGNLYNRVLREIELQLRRERSTGNAAAKGEMFSSAALMKAITDIIKKTNHDPFEKRKEMMAIGNQIRYVEKEIEAIKKVIPSLQQKLTEKYLKKDEAYQSILKLKKMYDKEVADYHYYSQIKNNVHQLTAKKDIVALKHLSNTQVAKFMMQWNSNKTFRENYEMILQSLEKRPLSRDRWTKNQSH